MNILSTAVLGILSASWIATIYCQDNWRWINPIPTGNTITDIEGIDGKTFFISDAYGEAFRTNDGAVTWTELKTNTHLTIRDIFLFDSNAVFFLCGDYDVQLLLYSTNGGKTISSYNISQYIPSYQILKKVQFTNKERGYLFYYSDTWEETEALTSRDSGKTWGLFFKADTIVNDFYVFDTSRVLFVGQKGLAAITSDGGKTWKRDSTFKNITCNALECFGGNSMYLLGSDSSIYISTDSAETWSGFHYKAPAPLVDMHFSDSLHGVAADGTGKLYSTIDGGVTWDGGVSKSAFVAAESGTALAGGAYGDLSISSDGGKTWKNISGATNEEFSTIAVQNKVVWLVKNGLLRGDTSRVCRSVDGGVTWETKITRQNTFADFQVLDSLHSFALGSNGTLFYSSNSGTDWDSVSLKLGGESGCTGCWFVTPQKGWIITTFRRIYSTADGGKTWSFDSTAAPMKMNHILFSTEQRGMCIGDSGMVITTTNGGSTWNAPIRISEWTLDGLTYVNDRIWVTSDGCGILSSGDWGATWDTAAVTNSEGFYFFTSIAFSDSLNGTAVGHDERDWANCGHCAVTNDGGKKWTVQPYLTSAEFRKIIYTSRNEGFICGQRGMLKRLYDPDAGIRTFAGSSNATIPRISFRYHNGRISAAADMPKIRLTGIEIFTLSGRRCCALRAADYTDTFTAEVGQLRPNVYIYKIRSTFGNEPRVFGGKFAVY